MQVRLMKILILTHTEIEELLPMRECIGVMEEALGALARGEMHQPLRMVVHPPDAGGVIALMPAYRSGADSVFGLKAICVFPGNAQKGKDAHQGGVLLFSGETGEPLALMNASAITAIRTAAVSAVATRLLVREDARELAIIGSGEPGSAPLHTVARRAQNPWRRCRAASSTLAHSQALADETGAEAVESVEEAVRGADVVV